MKILILSPDQSRNYNRGHQLFRDEIARQHKVVFYGSGYGRYNPERVDISAILLSLWIELGFCPDLILTYGLKYSLPFKGLGRVKDIAKIHILVDYHPWRIDKQDEFLRENKYDMVFTRVGSVAEFLKQKGLARKVFPLPFSVDTKVFRKKGGKKIFDVSAVMSEPVRVHLYPYRAQVKKAIQSLPLKSFTGNAYFDEYVEKINQSRIAITSASQYGWLGMAWTEILACGTFLLGSKVDDLDLLGLKDGKHFVMYRSLKDMEKKIWYYLEHEKERERIAEQGMEFIRRKHNNKQRVKDFIQIIEQEV